MKNRKSEYDVTSEINVSNAQHVSDAVIEILRDVYSNLDSGALRQAFEDCDKLFKGHYSGYLPCDTLYHDLQHTLDMTLALTRLINGYQRSSSKNNHIDSQQAVIAIITALYHDSGYIRSVHDRKHHNGAEYTQIHVSRSAQFLNQYMMKLGLGEHAQIAANMVHYTGYEVAPKNISLPDNKLHLLGHMLGTADMIAQMSDRCYLEKCRDRLYPEFVLGGVAVKIDEDGKEHVLYESGEDLLKKTPSFYENEVEKRLNKLFNGVYQYETAHFDGASKYIHALGQNQSRLKRVLEVDDFSMLRRHPPENYGTRNFPGLNEYLNQYPKKRQAR